MIIITPGITNPRPYCAGLQIPRCVCLRSRCFLCLPESFAYTLLHAEIGQHFNGHPVQIKAMLPAPVLTRCAVVYALRPAISNGLAEVGGIINLKVRDMLL